jgi:tetratricopeptide (TPR) repeat protein
MGSLKIGIITCIAAILFSVLSMTAISGEDGFSLEAVQAYNAGNEYRRNGELAEAVEAYRKAVELAPDLPQAYNNLGWTLHQMEKYQEAVDNYNISLRLKPDYYLASYNLGLSLEALGQGTRAIEVLTPVTLNSGDQDLRNSVYQTLGRLYISVEKYSMAKSVYRRVLETEPDSYDAQNGLGWVSYKLGEYKEAAAQFNRILSLDPKNIRAMINLGKVHHNDKNYDAALNHYMKAGELDSELNYNVEFQSDIGNAYLLKWLNSEKRDPRDLLLARKAFRQASEVEPKNAKLFYDLGYTEHLMNELEVARKHYRQAIMLKPELPYVREKLRSLYQIKPDYNLAVDEYTALVEQNPDDAWSCYDLAVFHVLKREEEKALDWLEKAVEKGYKDLEWISRDKDISPLRDNSRFKKLLKNIDN